MLNHIISSSLVAVLSGSDPSQATREIGTKLQSLQNDIRKCVGLVNRTRELKHKLLFTGWLHDYIYISGRGAKPTWLHYGLAFKGHCTS